MVQVFNPAAAAPQPVQLDPLMQAQATGFEAQQELEDLNRGTALANALRQSQTQLPGVMGQGRSAVGPGILNALGTFMQRRKGRQELDKIDARAAALRGDIQSGKLAELQAQQARQQAAWDQNRMMAQESRDFRAEQSELDRAHQLRLHEMKRDSKIRDTVAGGEVNLDGLPTALKTKYADASTALLDLNHIAKLGDSMTDAQKNELASPATQVAIRAATPAEFENYVKENLVDHSPEVKNFLLGLKMMDTEIRHAFYGAALSKGESAKFDGIATAIDGLDYKSRQQRVKNFAGKYERMIQGMDIDGSRGLLEPVKFRGFADESKQAEKAEAEAIKPAVGWERISPEGQSKFDEYYKLAGKYHKNDPRAKTSKPYVPERRDAIADIIGGAQPPPPAPAQPERVFKRALGERPIHQTPGQPEFIDYGF